MAPIGVSHGSSHLRLLNLISRRLGGQVLVQSQHPVRLSDVSEPQPDIAVLKPRSDFYSDRHPKTDDVLWVIEVSDSTVAFDRGAKLATYARHGIAEVWIVNLPARRLELYSAPQGERYTEQRSIGPGESFSGCSLPDETWNTAELLGWSE